MLDILSPIIKTQVRDFPVTTAANVDPSDASCFEQGMWFMFDTANAGHIIQATTASTCTYAFPIWSKKGEPTTQNLKQLACIFMQQFDADTDQFNSGASFTIGCPLTVASGLLTTTTTNDYVHAICVLPPASNNNKLRFTKVTPFVAK